MSNAVILGKLCDVLSQAYGWFVLCTYVSVEKIAELIIKIAEYGSMYQVVLLR